MLNEYLEFESYVTNPESPTPRVQPFSFTNQFDEEGNLIGIEHIMTVIARAYIFSNENVVLDEVISQQIVDDTKEVLHRWTGFADTKNIKRTQNERLDKWMKKYSFTEGWLKLYLTYQVNSGENVEKKNAREKNLWDKIEEEWSNKFDKGLDYLVSQISYNNIIANALEMGPLKNQYLVVRKDFTPRDKPVKQNQRFKYLTDESSRQASSDMKIMKIIATYLLKLKYNPKDQKEVLIVNGELANWYGLDDRNNGAETFYPKGVSWKAKPIYTTRRLKGSHIKVIVDQEYLKEFNFQIIDVEDADKYMDTHWVLEDLGHGLKECWGIK